MDQASLTFAMESSFQEAQKLLMRAQSKSLSRSLSSISPLDQPEVVDNEPAVAIAETSIEIEVPDASSIQELPSAFADTNISTRGLMTSQSDALLNSTLQKFRSQTSSYNSSPEPRKQDQRILKGLSSNSTPAKESPNATPKASSRIPVTANNAPLKTKSPKISSKNVKFTSIATSPIHPAYASVESEIQRTQLQNNVESEKLKKAIEEMEMTKIDKQLEAIETLQSRLYGISQKLSEKQEEQHDAIHKRALKQIKYLQELQNYQMDSQFDYVKKMKHALEDELRDTQLRVLESESSIESQSPNVSKAFETEVGTDNEPIIRKVKRKRAKGNFESKITSLMEEKFSLIQAEFEECIQEIHHLQDKLVKGSDTQRTVHVSPAPLRPSSEHPKSTATGLSDYQSVTKNIQDALSWSPLDDLIVLKKPFVVPNEESKSGKHNDSSAADLPKRSRIIVGQPIDYGRLNRLVTDLNKKWNRVLTSSQPLRVEPATEPLPSKAFSQDHTESTHYSDLMDPVRIQNLVERRIEQAMFEKISEMHQTSEKLTHFKPPNSEAYSHVQPIQKGNINAQKANKAISKSVLGVSRILDERKAHSASKSPVPKLLEISENPKAPRLQTGPPTAVVRKSPKKRVSTPAPLPAPKSLQKRVSTPARSPAPKSRSNSPLRPPNFYNVRLSNAPIFLRRTTMRPPTLDYLERRSPSPQKHEGTPTRSRSSSPVKKELFVQEREDDVDSAKEKLPTQNATIIQAPVLTEGDRAIEHSAKVEHRSVRYREPEIVKYDEFAQTGPMMKSHATQMTPYPSSSEPSELIQRAPRIKSQKVVVSSSKEALADKLQKLIVSHIGKDSATQYNPPSVPNADVSVQYSLSEEKSNNSVKFVKSATKPARRRDDDYVQPQEHSFLETGASLDDIEKKIAEWIQNEVLLRILAHGIQEETDLEQHDAPPSVAVAPPKLSQILEKKIVLETSTQASFMLDMGVQVDKLSESTESSVPQKEEATVTVPAPIVPSAEIAIESLVLESKAIADSIHKNDLEDRLWAKLKHEAEEREKFLKSLEDQRRLDQEERKRLMDEAAKERKRLMEEIRRMQQQAETESEHETEDKIDSFIVWQEKLETTLAQLVPGPSPVKVIQTQEIQTVAPVPVVADQSMQTDVPAIVEASAQKVAVTPDPPLKKTIVMHKEETAQVIIKQEEPAKRRPTLIHLGEEKVIYEDVSQVAESKTSDKSKSSSGKTDSSLTTSIGASILSTMLSEGEVVTHLYSEGEVIGPIERKALHNMVGLKEDDTLSGSEVKPKKKKKKRRGKTGRKEELSSIGETSRDIDSPGELSDNDHTQDVDVCPPLVYYVEAIDSASIVKEDERSPPSKPVADSLAWQDSSHILVNDDNLFSPKTPKTDRANRDESQSQAGSLSSVSQRTQETVSSPSFSVSESDVTPSRSPINRKTLFPLEDSLEEEDEN